MQEAPGPSSHQRPAPLTRAAMEQVILLEYDRAQFKRKLTHLDVQVRRMRAGPWPALHARAHCPLPWWWCGYTVLAIALCRHCTGAAVPGGLPCGPVM